MNDLQVIPGDTRRMTLGKLGRAGEATKYEGVNPTLDGCSPVAAGNLSGNCCDMSIDKRRLTAVGREGQAARRGSVDISPALAGI